jgi:membrane-bound lytic murein transglycosylase D
MNKEKMRPTALPGIALLLCLSVQSFALEVVQKDTIPPVGTMPALCMDNPEIAEIDKILVNSYLNHYCFTSDESVLNVYDYDKEVIPSFSTDIVKQRMKALDKQTPFDLVYNSTVQGFIDLYAVRRRDITSKVLGMSSLYFPMFEEYLAKHDIPLEMKYLAIVESALNPSIISSAGAGGLWQFMVATGKMYGLDVTSYQDERYDPFKATDAACRYLKFLYNTYDDWELALAAYNSGPGNVNKAIRRAGGVKDFWAIRPYLPKETQGYVPAFIAVNYVMNYASEHNIYPKKPLTTYFETDTVHVKERIRFSELSKVLDMSIEDLTFLNATYKLKEIPDNGQKHYLILPNDKIGLFLSNEDVVYDMSREREYQSEPVASATPASESKTVSEVEWVTYKVRTGDSLGKIANKYKTTTTQLKKWNKMRSNTIHPGQKLKVKQTVHKTVAKEDQAKVEEPKEVEEVSVAENKPQTQKEVVNTKESPKAKTSYKYYTVQRGDTLWAIANKYDGVTVDSIKDLNKGLSGSNLKVGQKIKVKQVG